ncbi:hypothetical protein BKA63DRAFT_569036 [Paraphoma chrysanthemicola]|nr:hypothetical protein BKA63DRAFT_569036 [Paraphoma chrysanthemicola]
MKLSTFLTAAGLATATQGCFLTAHTSNAGNFNVQHSEPKDHGGATQNVSWSHGGCTIKGQLLDGCSVKVSSANGCGSVSFTIAHAGRLARFIDTVESSE